jgi:hypothetical protein
MVVFLAFIVHEVALQMAKAGNMIPRVVNYEWLLDVAMSQQLKWNERYLIE